MEPTLKTCAHIFQMFCQCAESTLYVNVWNIMIHELHISLNRKLAELNELYTDGHSSFFIHLFIYLFIYFAHRPLPQSTHALFQDRRCYGSDPCTLVVAIHSRSDGTVGRRRAPRSSPLMNSHLLIGNASLSPFALVKTRDYNVFVTHKMYSCRLLCPLSRPPFYESLVAARP